MVILFVENNFMFALYLIKNNFIFNSALYPKTRHNIIIFIYN